MSPAATKSALLIVDNQRAFAHPTHWGPSRSNPAYADNVAQLLAAARTAGILVIHVKHLSLEPSSVLHPSAPAPANHPAGGLGTDLDTNTTPREGEPIIEKKVNSAFIGTNLGELIRGHKITLLAICGITTDHCVSTTARMASNLHVCDVDGQNGRIVFVGDATYCFKKPDGKWDAETIHAVHVESLREFADIATSEAVAKYWEGKAETLETV